MYFLIHASMFGSDTRPNNSVDMQLVYGRSNVPGPDTTPYSVVFPSLDVYVNGPRNIIVFHIL